MEDAIVRFRKWVGWLGDQRASTGGKRPSQEEIARLIGCSQVFVSTILSGAAAPSRIEIAERIERATADWPSGPIGVGEWLHAKVRKRPRRARAKRRGSVV